VRQKKPAGAKKQTHETAPGRDAEIYHLILENVNEAIAIVQDLKFVFFNPRLSQISGYSAEELTAGLITGFVHPEDRKKVRTNHQLQLKRMKIPVPYIIRLSTKSGDIRWIDIKSATISWNGVPATLNFYTDITERKQAETVLYEANKKLKLISSITRHDIKNQVMALMAYLELCKDSLDNPKELAEYIGKQKEIVDIINSQITITSEFEDMGLNPPLWQNTSRVIRDAVADHPRSDIHVIVNCDDLELFADPLLKKVFYNLIDNALRYGGDRMVTIRFSFHESENTCTIVCEDDGAGISDEDKKHLFTRGFGKNTGLGLYLSRELLSLTGMMITENGAPGKGARFEITVPKGVYRFIKTL